MNNASIVIELASLESSKLEGYAWPGGYPLFYITQDGGALCPDCAREAESEGLTSDPDDPQWYIIACQTNLENTTLYCDHCNKHIESAYGDD